MEELKEKKIFLTDIGDGTPEIEILIGSRHFQELLTGRRFQLKNGLWAVETKLGWTLNGTQIDNRNNNLVCSLMNLSIADATVAKLWELEALGIKDPIDHKTQEQKDLEAAEHFKRTVSRSEDGRYCVSLPWVDENIQIQSNKNVAEQRLINATRGIVKKDMFHHLDEIFNSWVAEGFIEEVPMDEMDVPCHYLPHRPVYRPDSATTPIRPVFDASCKSYRSPSLNDCLCKGPNLLETIPSLLLKFREKAIGGIGDIRKAFQMIDIRREDQDFVRFLWWEDSSLKNMKVYRHKRVVFGLNCSPYLLGAVIQHHLELMKKDEPEVTEKLLTSFYVDNLVFSVDSMEDYEHFKSKSITIMEMAKMTLREWECSSVETLGIGQLDSRGCGLSVGGQEAASISNKPSFVLGYVWNKKEDTLSIDMDFEVDTSQPSKRIILSSQQQIFDPIGVACPALLYPKLLLQETWGSKLKWDEKVPEDIEQKFCKWVQELFYIGKIKIPRVFNGGIGSHDKWQLHIFSDASKYAYACVVFLRAEDDDGNISIQLLAAKSRVAPMKKCSIPRLELMGCNIGARLEIVTSKDWSEDNITKFFWTDSTTALAWIRRNDEWGTFVGNRVREICQLTKVEDWRFVPGALNPADLPSRGCSPKALVESKWWEGPEWLRKSEAEWPNEPEEADEELVNMERKKMKTITMVVIKNDPWFGMKSSFTFCVKILSWVLRFVNIILKKPTHKTPTLHREEIENAEKVIWRLVQDEAFPKTTTVINGLAVKKNNDQLFTVETKIFRMKDVSSFLSPIVLPSQHIMVEKLVTEVHIKSCHAGLQIMMSLLREKFWIVRSRKTIRRILNKCIRCKRFSAKSREVKAAPLPEARVKDAAVFETTGVDFAGPLYTKDNEKMYFCVFTCAVYRCVHLELVSSLSTDGFLDALTRFIARRGRPVTIYADNGTNFVGAKNLLRGLEWKTIQQKVDLVKIRWMFNPPSAPWWGGFWERIVRMVKDLLKRMLGRAILSTEKLMTCLCEIEGAINGRPLTYISEDPEDLTPLTPSMFMQDIPNSWTTDLQRVEERDDLNGKLQRRKTIREELRDRFRKEYLSLLVNRNPNNKCFDFQVGDLVLIGSDDKRRITWPLARIVETYPGADGVARVAKLKTSKGYLTRPFQRLFPLEVSVPEEVAKLKNIKDKSTDNKHEVSDSSTVEEIQPELRTRLGRIIKKPLRFN